MELYACTVATLHSGDTTMHVMCYAFSILCLSISIIIRSYIEIEMLLEIATVSTIEHYRTVHVSMCLLARCLTLLAVNCTCEHVLACSVSDSISSELYM